MGRGKEVLGDCFRAHALLCKVLAVVLIIVSVGCIITGIVFIVKYANVNTDFDDDEVDWFDSGQNLGNGIGFLLTGLLGLLCSILTTCCAFQFGAARRFVDSRNDQGGQQAIVEQPLPQQSSMFPSTGVYPPQVYPPQGYPPQAYPAPPPLPGSFEPPNAPLAMPPPILPSYEQASHTATAPMPFSPPLNKQ